MISNMLNGWCDITVFGYAFPHRASYMNDYPTEIAAALLDAYQAKRGEFVVDMEEHGAAECTIDNNMFTIDCFTATDKRSTVDIRHVGGLCTAMGELLSDIESNWGAMIDWGMPMSEEEYVAREKLLGEICGELRNAIKQ